MDTFIFTCGDINGIGPEICLKTINEIYSPGKYRIIFICPSAVFINLTKKNKPNFDFSFVHTINETNYSTRSLLVYDIGKCRQQIGVPTKDSGNISFKAVNISLQIMNKKMGDALITAPISKEAWKMAGINFPGHTEFITKKSGAKNSVMMFVSDEMKAVPLTIHIPVKKVSRSITEEKLSNSIKIVMNSLSTDFKIRNPRIAMLGLNPHAGESGSIGVEENKIIVPLMKKMKRYNVEGPFVPDAFFGRKLYKEYDAVIGMYHDQVLIPFKMLSFEKGVNFTAGLKIISTSPDHGTAFDIAGKNTADPGSMIEAFKIAKSISSNRKS